MGFACKYISSMMEIHVSQNYHYISVFLIIVFLNLSCNFQTETTFTIHQSQVRNDHECRNFIAKYLNTCCSTIQCNYQFSSPTMESLFENGRLRSS